MIRLKEKEVYLACAEIVAQGERPTSLNLLEKLGRGSLTTITKHLNSWNKTDAAQAGNADSLPVVAQLPPELLKSGGDLLKKIWHVAKHITDKELATQREALTEIEIAGQLKIDEAFKFTETQALKIEKLEDDLSTRKDQIDDELKKHIAITNALNDAEKEKIGLSKDIEQLRKENIGLKKQVKVLELIKKKAHDAEKQIAKLEGQLSVYQTIKNQKK